ncbi:hypothetical protein VVD49_06420 [Uliginosibacterium sp. H3]|uniref:Uncharacterized protein n=1 Tax=Uliginosibacterium silvisoli TaxID=3114758 RepID=A0ABU6K2U6_9RHOO|nr:hypothetical protein [Uliginosibacterium sp. H3]
MSIRTIQQPLPGERVVGLSPETAVEAASDWLRRPNLFPGRALGAAALQQRQQWQAGHIAQRGQDWVAGVVEGLQVEVSLTDALGFGGVRLSISRGRGLAVSGEDVVLNTHMDCVLADVSVAAPPGFFMDGSGVGDAEDEGNLRARTIDEKFTLGTLDAASLATLPAIGVLVLQPALVDTSSFDPSSPCERSACDEGTVNDAAAFEDWRIADAVRLVWYVWPQEWRRIPASTDAQLRNALAAKIFDAESALSVDDCLPWEEYGVPIALVGLNAGQQPAWVDRASVVRKGGLARDARLQLAAGSVAAIAANSRLPSLWQARIEQFAEQVAAAGDVPPETLAEAFGVSLPPVGLLPKNAFDPSSHASDFFPPGFDIDAAPIPVDQLDLAVRASAGLAPLDLAAQESVRVLVPVPLQSWEPRLLVTESVDPEFQKTLDRYLLTRARTLGLRQGMRNRSAMLRHALNGETQIVPTYKEDPQALEPETLKPWGEPPPGGGHRSQLLAGMHQHFFDGATTKFNVKKGESLFVWVCLDQDNPPRMLMLQWHEAGGWEHRAYWGENLIGGGTDGTASHLRAGDLPTPGAWTQLKVSAAALGLEDKDVDGMAFTLFDGRAAYGLAGARVDQVWRKWFCNFLPLGARVQGNETWDLLTANDLWMPFEEHDGVVPSLPALIGNVSGDILGQGGEDEEEQTPAALAVPTKGINVYYPQAAGWRGHQVSFDLKNLPQVPAYAKGDKLSTWIYLDELSPPRSICALAMCTGYDINDAAKGFAITTAFWGENRFKELSETVPGFATFAAKAVRAGALPQSGLWVPMELPFPTAITDGDGKEIPGVTKFRIVTVLFLSFGGNLAFSDIQAVRSGTVPKADVLWPKDVVAGQPVPAFKPFLNAKLTLQNNLGVLTPTPSSRIGTVRVYTDLVGDPLIKRLSNHEQSQILLRGLSGFADYLRRRIDRADDITDFGFAHMQVDMHRVRQLMLSTSDASRLAVSPALAAIAKSDSALTVQSQIKDYVGTVKAAARVAAPPAATTVAATIANIPSSARKTSARLITPPRAPLNIVYASPVIGLTEIRTTAIADRLKAPPSTEARDYALSNRHRTVSSLLDLLEAFAKEDSGEVPALLTDFEIFGLPNDPFLVGAAGGKRKLADFRNNANLLAQLLTPPTGSGVDEATLFTQTVALSDSTIAILRQLEARLTIYRDALNRCESALQELLAEAAQTARHLQNIADDLAEARHDVSVARALLDEETRRIDAINKRRMRVLNEEVKFVAYIRPRETDNLLATPTHAVDPGLLDAPVPACLREHPDVADELLDMLRVVREAPATWFVRIPPLIKRLDKVEPLVRMLQTAQARAHAGIATPILSTLQAASTANVVARNKLSVAMSQVTTRQVEALAPRITALQTLNIASFANFTWQGIQTHATEIVSFADLAEGGHGRADVSRDAASELQNIRSIVACLHAEFSGIAPVLRLEWAETLSEFDAAPNLRNLASLPRWAEIGYIDRRQMQAYVDWLFAQIEPNQPQAVALINDVIRMCLLLASHAPIDRIVSGRMARPITGVSPGIRIPLTVLEPSKLRVGMQALIYKGDSVVARAVVEDLGQLEVSAHVIHTSAARVDLGDDVRVHFDEAASVSMTQASAKRTLFGR